MKKKSNAVNQCCITETWRNFSEETFYAFGECLFLK